jgi:hypothetical protein
MLKRIFIVLSVIAIAAPFVSTKAFSQDVFYSATTASGYQFQALKAFDGMTDEGFPEPLDAAQFGLFPYLDTNGNEVWPYRVNAPPKQGGTSALNQVCFEIPITSPRIDLLDIWPSGKEFSYSIDYGCEGDDTTGVFTALLKSCAIKWTFQLRPGSGASRFYFITNPDVAETYTNLNLMAPKIGNVIEPVLMMGPSATSFTSAPTPTFEERRTGEFDVCIEYVNPSLCQVRFYLGKCSDPDKIELEPYEGELTLNGQVLTFVGGDDNFNFCRKIVMKSGSGTCWTVKIGGTTFSYGYPGPCPAP